MSRSGGSGIELARRSGGLSVHDTRCRRFADPLGAPGRRPRRRLSWDMVVVVVVVVVVVEFVVVEAERLRPGHSLYSPELMRGRWEGAAGGVVAAVGAAAAGEVAAVDEPAAAVAGQLATVVVGVAAVVVAAVPGGEAKPAAANDYYAE